MQFLLTHNHTPRYFLLSRTADPRKNVHKHIDDDQIFMVYKTSCGVAESPSAEPNCNYFDKGSIVFWLGPPAAAKDGGDVTRITSKCLMLLEVDAKIIIDEERLTNLIVATCGYAAIWDEDLQRFSAVIADFDDFSNHVFTDSGRRDFDMLAWETSGGGPGTFNGAVGSMKYSWSDKDNQYVKEHQDRIGMKLTPKNFDTLYEKYYNQNHA